MSAPRYEATDLFGEGIAESYDEVGNPMFDGEVLDRTVDVLDELAADGATNGQPDAFELAIGTGRVALPLSARGVAVAGVDLSGAMLAELRRKPGAESVDAHEAGMTDFRLGRTFGLVYLVFNTIGNVTTQDGQVAVFETAAAHLRPGGRFVVEMNLPDLQRLPRGERFRPFTVSDSHLGIDEYDVVEQGLISHHFLDRGDAADGAALRRRSVPFRYVWPAELDLMARIAGLDRDARWQDWDRSPFTALSDKHVSVWRKPLV